MNVPTSEVGYTSTTTGRGDHEVHKGHVVTLAKKLICMYWVFSAADIRITLQFIACQSVRLQYISHMSCVKAVAIVYWLIDRPQEIRTLNVTASP
jgi:hypothetical protein